MKRRAFVALPTVAFAGSAKGEVETWGKVIRDDDITFSE